MKRFLPILVLCALDCLGQSAASSKSKPSRPVLPGGERNLSGCLVKDASGSYFMQLASGRKVRLTGASDAESHVGQRVRASGSFTSMPVSGTQAPAKSDKQATERDFKVVGIQTLAKTCPPPVRKKSWMPAIGKH
jgi:hypothetical protein